MNVQTSIDIATLNRAGALLVDAAGMLRIEAQEWRARKNQMATGGEWTPKNWAERCARIAAINETCANSMSEVAKKIAEATGQKAA